MSPTKFFTFHNKNILTDYGELETWKKGDCNIFIQNGIKYEGYYSGYKSNIKGYQFITAEQYLKNLVKDRKRKMEVYYDETALSMVRYINKLKINFGCSWCGYKEHPDALIFDHIIPSQKNYEICDILMDYRKHLEPRLEYAKKLFSEIRLCDVMCANCHYIKTKEYKCGREKLFANYTTIDEYSKRAKKDYTVFLIIDENDQIVSNSKKIRPTINQLEFQYA